jgi:general secretion pathway protein G
VVLNTYYDLYSVGKDGATSSSLNASVSFDDVVRANDGGFLGQAAKF